MKRVPAARTDALAALFQRVRDSLVGQSVMRFVLMEGFDRCIVLSAQAFTALIPLFIVVASAAPAGQEKVVSEGIVNRFALTGESAAAVEQLFVTPPGASSGVTLFSALLLLYSGVAFTRRLQRMYRAAFRQQKAAMRSTLFATLGLAALVVEVIIAYGIRGFTSRFPLEWLWALPISVATGLVLWTSIPYLLLDRRVHWRRLLAVGGMSAVGLAVLTIGTPIYMPELMARSTNEFGLFGITITLIGWLLAAAFILVAATAIGAEFDASGAPWLVRLKDRFRLTDPEHELRVVDESERRGLTGDDLVVLIRGLTNWLILTGAVAVATWVVPGIDVRGGLATYLFISLLVGLVNAVLGPLVHWLVGPRSWIQLGGSALLVNGLLLVTTAGLSQYLDIDGLVSVVLGALVVSVAGILLELVIRPVLAAQTPPPDV